MTTKLKWAACLMVSTLVFATSSFAQEDPDTKQTDRLQQKIDKLEAENSRLKNNNRETNDARTLKSTIRADESNFEGLIRNQASNLPPTASFPVANLPGNPFAQRTNGFNMGQSNLTIASSSFGRRDPKLAEAYNAANQKLSELVQQLKGADGEEAKLELKEEIKSLLEEKYDAYLEHHEAPLIQLEERLETLREEFESRKKARDELVKLRLDTIWFDAIGLGWPDNQRGTATIFGLNRWRDPGLDSGPALLVRPAAPTAPDSLPPNRTPAKRRDSSR